MSDALKPQSPMKKAHHRGLLIAFEGLDRSGKSTQVGLLEEYFRERGVQSRQIKFPDRTTLVGKTIDEYLKGKNRISDEVIHLLFSSNRWELKNSILEDLNKGVNVILDRYAYSGVVYSSVKGLDLDWCKNCDRNLPKPDVVIFLKIHEKVTSKRDLYGEEIYEKIDFQEKVRENYGKIREDNWAIIDATQTIEIIHEQISQIIEINKNEVLEQVSPLWVTQK